MYPPNLRLLEKVSESRMRIPQDRNIKLLVIFHCSILLVLKFIDMTEPKVEAKRENDNQTGETAPDRTASNEEWPVGCQPKPCAGLYKVYVTTYPSSLGKTAELRKELHWPKIARIASPAPRFDSLELLFSSHVI